MRVFVVSDMHISGVEDPLYGSLLRLIRERAVRGDTVVLGGDIFDLFVGNKAVFKRLYGEFMTAVDQAHARGVEIHYIEGNHDFMMKVAFRGVRGIQVHSREVELRRGGRRFLFAHGDLIDREDYGYLALRTFLRSPLARTAAAVVPGKFVVKIGERSSRMSSGREGRSDPARFERTRKLFRNFAALRLADGLDFIVLGHCHDLDQMEFKIDGRIARYFNVGFPRQHGSMVVWDGFQMEREPLP